MDIAAYLQRIDYHGPTEPTAEALRDLHRAHLLTVPFENLDIHLGKPISLDEETLFDKIVPRRRGGFCYELNGMFAALLRELGFRVSLLNSVIPEKHNGRGKDYDHLVLLVELAERWIADVGFGDAYRSPLRLDEPGEQMGVCVAYRISPVEDGRWKFWERAENGEWEFYYAFGLQPCRLLDFAEACHYYETSPRSSFTQKRICSRATPDGHISLTEGRLITVREGRRQERPLANEVEFVRCLNEHFGIALDRPLPSREEETSH